MFQLHVLCELMLLSIVGFKYVWCLRMTYRDVV